jgi:hypothetical protein
MYENMESRKHEKIACVPPLESETLERSSQWDSHATDP